MTVSSKHEFMFQPAAFLSSVYPAKPDTAAPDPSVPHYSLFFHILEANIFLLTQLHLSDNLSYITDYMLHQSRD